MSRNMTICPECGTAFETEDSETDLPIQRLDQQCPSCSYDVSITILYYTSVDYEVIGPALRDDECSCGNDAFVRRQRVGEPVITECGSCVADYRYNALSG